MSEKFNFYQMKHRFGAFSARVTPATSMTDLFVCMGWTELREQINDQVYMEVAIHIRFQLKSSSMTADKTLDRWFANQAEDL